MLKEYIMEIRYEPIGHFLDIRGAVADYMQKNMFGHWQIGNNQVDFWNAETREEDKNVAFVSHRNCGYSSIAPPTDNFFEDNAGKFVRVLCECPHFRLPSVTRLGVRFRFFMGSKKPFEDLKKAVTKTFYRDEVGDLVGGEIVDVAATLISQQKDYSLNFNLGPMEDKQVKQVFRTGFEDLEKSGLFVDMDFFQKDVGEAEPRLLVNRIKDFSYQAHTRLEGLKARLL
jgi:hypothetical protein